MTDTSYAWLILVLTGLGVLGVILYLIIELQKKSAQVKIAEIKQKGSEIEKEVDDMDLDALTKRNNDLRIKGPKS